MDWYSSLNKPSLNPPSWIFAPVWTILYIIIAYSFYLYLQKKPATIGVIVFSIHMLTNFAWSPLFFTLKKPTWALADIGLMIITLILTIYLFNKRSHTAAALLIPYLAWVSFASYLNYKIVVLNSRAF